MRSTAGLLLIAGMFVVCFCGSSAAQGPGTGKDIVRQVDTHYNHLHSLTLQFAERYNGMGMERTEGGTLSLAKPGRMRWNYTKPAGKLFVLDGKFAYSYSPGDAEAQRYQAKQLDDFRSPLRFLLGHTQLQTELANLTVTPNGAKYRLQGTPIGMEQQVVSVAMTVNAHGEIEAMRWQGTDGSTTEFLFYDEQANPPMPQGTFTFQAPPGVVVVDGLAPI